MKHLTKREAALLIVVMMIIMGLANALVGCTPKSEDPKPKPPVHDPYDHQQPLGTAD